MDKVMVPSTQKVREAITADTKSSLFADIKALLKGPVLIANVLPVFTGFWLALYFANASIADYWNVLFLTMLGSTFVIAGALVINNWYDKDIDTVMDRTKHRPTVTGHFSMNTVLTLGIICTVIGFILLSFTTLEAVIYGFIGWFTYVFLYTMWTKRKYTLNTVVGSISGAVTPMIGWTVIEPGFQLVPVVLFLILFIFQMPHTFSIAMKKYDDYKAANVAMLPVVHGFEMTKRQMVVYVACLMPLPFFLFSLGTTFIVIATLLNIGWLAVAFSGFFMKNDYKYAQINFLYSVNYIMILFLMMVVVTLPIFQ